MKIITRKQNFTIVEVLIVIAIIAILAGLLLAALAAVNEKKDKVATQDILQKLSIGLTKYYEDNGDYPAAYSGGGVTPAEQTIPTAYSSQVLITEIIDKGYASISSEFIKDKGTANARIVDKFESQIYYIPADEYAKADTKFNGADADSKGIPLKSGDSTYHNPTSYQLRSFGSNKQNDDGTKDDVQNF